LLKTLISRLEIIHTKKQICSANYRLLFLDFFFFLRRSSSEELSELDERLLLCLFRFFFFLSGVEAAERSRRSDGGVLARGGVLAFRGFFTCLLRLS
jgi:hypothetical protein